MVGAYSFHLTLLKSLTSSFALLLNQLEEEEQEVAKVLKVLRVGQAVEQAGMLEPRSHILHQGRGAAAKAKGEWS